MLPSVGLVDSTYKKLVKHNYASQLIMCLFSLQNFDPDSVIFLLIK